MKSDNALNRLIQIESGSKRTIFLYNGQSQRVGRTEYVYDGTNWNLTEDVKYLWDGGIQPVQERDSTGNTVTRHHFAGGFADVQPDQSLKHYYCTKDHLGSTREVLNEAGVVETRYDYSPFGEVEVLHASANDVRATFLYTGHLYHEESNLHLTLFRAYDPVSGRWLSADPIKEDGGLNLYAYVGNNPINMWDPLGLAMFGLYHGTWGEYFSDVGDVFVGQAKGAAENLSFGIYKPCYKNEMQSAGGKQGDALVTVAQVGTGVGALKVAAKKTVSNQIKKEGRKLGKEFSHGIADRYFRKTSKYYKPRLDKYFRKYKDTMLNGNMVSPMRHFKHDPFRYPTGWKGMGNRFSPLLQKLDRIPNSIKKAGGAFGYAAGSHAARSGGGDCP